LTGELTIEQFYSEGKKSGRVLGLVCDKGHITVPPRHSCRVCDSTALKIKVLTGLGEVASITEVHVKAKDFPLETPYVLALVKLEDGGNLLGVMKDDKCSVSLGGRIKVNFRSIRGENSQPMIFFEKI
jgi:uncharacterized OB-fold protein